MPKPSEIWLRYSAYVLNGGTLSPEEWLMHSFPDRYKNRASAASQMRKFRKGTRSGRTLRSVSEETYLGPSEKVSVDDEGNYTFVRDTTIQRQKRPGLYEAGYWKVIVDFRWLNDQDEWVYETRSYSATSGQYFSALDIPEIERILEPATAEKIQEWSESGSIPPVYEVLRITVIPINTTKVQERDLVNLDEYGYERDQYSE